MNIPAIRTERLLLRGFEERDLDAYAAMMADPDVARYVGDGKPADRATAWRQMAMMIGHWTLRGYGFWAVEEAATGLLVGRAGLFFPEGWPGLEAGWALARGHWGKGYATEAARAAIDFAFDVVGAERVISVIVPANHRSIRVAERLGERFLENGRVAGMDVAIYGIDRAERG